MKKRVFIILIVVFAAIASLTQAQNPGEERTLVDRVGDTGFIQVRANSFYGLSRQQKHLAYWLTQAAIAIDPIIYDQVSQFGIRQKRLLEEIVAHPQGIDRGVMRQVTDFAKLFWANRGNHNAETAQKFLPAFTFDELKTATLTAQRNGAMASAYANLLPLKKPAELEKELEQLRPSLFDANFEPMTTAKSPEGGKDIIQASSNTFYEGVSLADLKNFHDTHPLNSRVMKGPDGRLQEEVYRAGTPDGRVPLGLYAVYLKKANEFLAKAQQFADPKQAQAIGDLIRYYETGDPQDWLRFGTDWVQNNEVVDFDNGFIEVYLDARNAKGSSQAFVSVNDQPVTNEMVKLGQAASYFEQKAPWAPQYKRKDFRAPVVKAIETVVETGDFHVTTIGDNLPNENEIHERYGTKNFIFTSSTRAFDKVQGSKMAEEFAATPAEIAREKGYGDKADDLHTALHEIIGHGSGRLSPRLRGGAEPYLKEYFSTLEEARADLMALWNVWDPKLKELGIVTDQEEIAKTMYDQAARVALTQLRRMPKGDTIEEDHARDRALIVNYITDKTGAIRQIERNGKTYYEVVDYQKMRQGVGTLLAELMRIKAEGEYDSIKTLVNKYGVHFNPALRDQVVGRFKKLDMPTYWAGVNPKLKLSGTKVEMSYPEDPVEQYLRYGSMYDEGLAKQNQESGVSASGGRMQMSGRLR